MSLTEDIDRDIKAAMLAREQDKLTALRAVKAALLLARTEKGSGHELQADDEARILQKLIKQRQESADIYVQQNRGDLAEKEKFEANVIAAYLPEQLSEEEISAKVQEIITKTGANGMKDMGKVMGMASRELAGKADNKIVAAVVKQLLS
ncbi:MAG: GatB/YqeY domain-containing protein [Flavobacteriales bacterium]|nr:GatB/YqeY domain-containing protein [Flavobacteriales bacterium]MCB9449374.1 GatB/YqeY domain-containing protein [Flavobacteriales bacterium]